MRTPLRGQGVSPGLAGLPPLPEASDLAGRPELQELVAAVRLAEAAAALALWPLSEDELGVSLQLMARLSGALDRCQVGVVGEAHARGAGTTQGRSTVDWVVGQSRGRVPAARAAQLLRVARCAQQTGLTPQPDQPDQPDQPEGGLQDDDSTPGASGSGSVYEAFTSGELPWDKADRIGRFQADVRPIATEGDIAADTAILVAAACDDEHGPGVTVPELARASSSPGRTSHPPRSWTRVRPPPGPRAPCTAAAGRPG